MIAKGMATPHELSTVYGLEDLYDMLEIISVENHNRALIAEHRRED